MESDKEEMLRQAVLDDFLDLPQQTSIDLDDWIQNGVFQIKDFMCDEQIVFLIKKYRDENNAIPLKVVFAE
ncbi:hypothetical protein [Enterobacter vonholyi]|uniref:hypothetical protein n=1 Tax=Enterobacter vonholyi TaxID=2797505 RepID=UPI002DB8433A|nr:hypothetical protein [Enterobacter vonholyi]MEB5981810.1 hypothetical protein [Enterobacter vonholyi]